MQVPLRPHQRGIIILNAVAPMHQAEDTSPPSNAVPTNPQLAYIGRFSQEKQPYLLLDMLRLLPARFHLTLIGDGPLADPLRQAGADLLACARLTLVGPQAHGPRMYAPWHLTLLASRYEGCPMSLLESFSAGVPCVGFPIAALQEIVGEDAPYLLAHDHSAQALTDAVQNILARPRSQVQADMARILSRHQLKDFIQSWQTVLLQMTMPC